MITRPSVAAPSSLYLVSFRLTNYAITYLATQHALSAIAIVDGDHPSVWVSRHAGLQRRPTEPRAGRVMVSPDLGLRTAVPSSSVGGVARVKGSV